MGYRRKIFIVPAIGCLLFSVFALVSIYFSLEKGQITDIQQSLWNNEFHKLGLADVPEKAKWTKESDKSWGFRADTMKIMQWLADSPSIQVADAIIRPRKQAFIFASMMLDKACLVMVITPKDESWVFIETIKINEIKDKSSNKVYTRKEALRACREELNRSYYWNAPSSIWPTKKRPYWGNQKD